MHLSLPNAANSDLLLPASLITANSDPCGKNITEGPQPTLLLSFSSSTVVVTLGGHPPLGDFTTIALNIAAIAAFSLKKDTPQLATHTIPTFASYTNLQTLKIEGFLEQ
ncbi:hypothetical protein GW17_00060819 [Ensete ventricosum]|nr:hypothetical protein GW17_00060819 [Ensete ventricosum]RZS16720.1 hypothetical protein BHM03_00048749 [Ensete ventricosum]